MERIKIIFTTVLSVLMSWLGILAVPVFLMVGCNVIDYITGMMATKYREESISSYKGIRGIMKKVCMWLLIIVGSWIDILLRYTLDCAGIDNDVPFIVATVVAVWLVVNEIISILENMIDIGVEMPPFLMPEVKHMRKQIEETVDLQERQGRENEIV